MAIAWPFLLRAYQCLYIYFRSATTPDDTIGEGRMYACPESQLCPVRSFKKYLTKLHPKLDALWQRPREFYDDDDSVWYYNSPAGKHTLSQMMASISKKSKLSKLYTNHSIRATTITSLDHAGFEARHIMRTSGHKSEASIRSYSSRLSESKKREISSTLSRALCDQSVKSEESSVAGNHIPELSEQELMEVFSDENMFVQVDGNRQATATATDDDTTTPQNPQTLFPHVQNPVQNGGHQPFNQLSVHNTCNTNLTCGGQGVNPFLRNLQYSINPTCNNSTIHFHFYGKQ